MPIRGSKHDLEFIHKSIPALIRLNPAEILFGLDDPIQPHIVKAIDQLCSSHGNFNRYRVIATDHKKQSWNMRLALVLYECFLCVKTDKVLVLDSDMVVTPDVMDGFHAVGKNNIALHSGFNKFLNCNSRFKLWRWYVKNLKNLEEFSGCMFLYLPFILKAVDLEKFKKIHNGCDGFILNALRQKNYTLISSRKYMCYVIGTPNSLISGVEYAAGIYSYVLSMQPRYIKKGGWRRHSRRIVIRYFPRLIYFRQIAMGNSIWWWRGMKFAKDNPNNEIVKIAKKSSNMEWTYLGVKLVKNHYNWNYYGAGFN